MGNEWANAQKLMKRLRAQTGRWPEVGAVIRAPTEVFIVVQSNIGRAMLKHPFNRKLQLIARIDSDAPMASGTFKEGAAKEVYAEYIRVGRVLTKDETAACLLTHAVTHEHDPEPDTIPF